MERTDWLDQGYSSAEARFLMLTAITRHRFGSPMDKDEVRKLQLELNEIDLHLELTEIGMPTTQATAGHATRRARRPQSQPTERGDFG